MASIRLLADSILQTDEMDPAMVRDFVGDIGSEAERLTRITEHLLALTRLVAVLPLTYDANGPQQGSNAGGEHFGEEGGHHHCHRRDHHGEGEEDSSNGEAEYRYALYQEVVSALRGNDVFYSRYVDRMLVRINSGLAGSSSSFSRRRRTWTSTVR